jgi:MFS superfamily sulfate permease-like transporter
MFSKLKSDLPAGLVVFLVALPLCLGIALASGAPFFSGIISGIIGGIVIGAISNSQLSVSGPAAGLSALVLGAITSIGTDNFPLFLCAVLIAGILQILLGVFKLGGIAKFIPSSVIKGLLTSIGIIIIAKQLPIAFGFKNLKELFDSFQDYNIVVLSICILSILIILGWDKVKVKFIPGALIAVIIGIVLNEIFKSSFSNYALDATFLVNVPVAKSASEFLGFFTVPDFKGFMNSTIIIYGVVFAIIASVETLLSIEAIDELDSEKRETNTNRELIAQGIGNTVAGLIGGLPVTSVIVRSSANVNSGGKTKMATIFHGFLLLISVILIPTLLNKIPLSALAAILFLTGYKLAKPAIFKDMVSKGFQNYLPFFVTIVFILAIDLFEVWKPISGKGLLIGVIAGIISYYIIKDKKIDTASSVK